MSLVWILFLVAIGAWVFYIVSGFLAAHLHERQRETAMRQMEANATDLLRVRDAVDILRSQSERYFLTLQTAGFAQLCHIHDSVHVIDGYITDLFDKEDYVPCIKLSRWLEDTRRPVPLMEGLSNELFMSLYDWQVRSTEAIASCTNALLNTHTHEEETNINVNERARVTTRHNIDRLKLLAMLG